ncbi:unnamed protein product [Moneuplotes crassus]|uniref:C2H2-type domain-containing protein n=1 Tax=Euplotes crassus TaxID=5936 RepID=A0AAD1URW6_EUPCR|nr:unnamed protein product [Moneuplotes crassus]
MNSTSTNYGLTDTPHTCRSNYETSQIDVQVIDQINLPVVFLKGSSLPVPVLLKPNSVSKETQLFELSDGIPKTKSYETSPTVDKLFSKPQLLSDESVNDSQVFGYRHSPENKEKLTKTLESTLPKVNERISLKPTPKLQICKDSEKQEKQSMRSFCPYKTLKASRTRSASPKRDQLAILKDYKHSVMFIRHENTERRILKCEIPGCNESFKTIKKFFKHSQLHLKSSLFQCRYCSTQLESLSNLKRHILSHRMAFRSNHLLLQNNQS